MHTTGVRDQSGWGSKARRSLLGATTIIVALGLMAPASWAKSKGGVTMPNSVTVEGQKLVLNGMGIREATMLKVDVYVAGLYVPEKTSNASKILGEDGPKEIRMEFVRDVDRSDMLEAFDEGFKANAGGTYSKIARRVGKLKGWLADMEEGEKVKLTYVPGKGTKVNSKGRGGTIEGWDFAQVLFKIWLGPKPPNAGLKKGMLGR